MLRNLVLVLIGVAGTAAPCNAQILRGRVVDQERRAPMPGVRVTLARDSIQFVTTTTTGAGGYFSLRLPEAGGYEVRIDHPGFDALTSQVVVASGRTDIPAIVLAPDIVALDSLEVRVRSRGKPRAPNAVRPHALISGDRMALLESHGIKPLSVVRDLQGVRVRQQRNYLCIESARRMPTFQQPPLACEPVVLVIDGIVVGDPNAGLRPLNLSEIESIHLLSPMEAGFQYGLEAGAVGAIVVWTRGRGPFVSEERNGRQ